MCFDFSTVIDLQHPTGNTDTSPQATGGDNQLDEVAGLALQNRECQTMASGATIKAIESSTVRVDVDKQAMSTELQLPTR